MRTIKKINIIVLLLTTLLWSTVPSGLILAAENGESNESSKLDIIQLETPVEILPNESELIPESIPDELTPVTPIEPITPIKPIIPNDELIPELTPTDHKLVPDDEEREPRNPLDEENPVDEAAKRDNAGLQPKNNGQYSVDEFTGVFSYDYPLQIPAGRNGLQPSISLQYNHRLNNIGSAVGVGWQLTMPSIERSNRTGLDNLYTDNYFRLNLAGSDDLVAIDVDANGYGTYGKQIESDFLKVEFASTSNAWIVTDKLGTVYTFGATTASRQDNPTDNAQVYKWLLNEIRDTNDNFVRYEYYKDSGQIYPKKIFYTGHGATDGIFEVDFEPFANGNPVENNIDNISYQTGFGVETKYLLDSIDIQINGELTTRYDLVLNLNANDNKYLLDGIIPRFYQDGNDFVKDQVEFDYSESINTYKEGEGYDLPYALGSNPGTFNSKSDMFMDLNGDSYTDYLRLFCSNGNVSLSVWLNDANGHWSTSTPYAVAQAETGIVCKGPGTTIRSMPVSFGNINGDHFIDMITDDTVYYNTGSNWQVASTTLPISLNNSSVGDNPPIPQIIFQDMNADGYDDIVYEHHPNNHQSDVDIYIKDQATNTWNLDNNFHLSVDQQQNVCLLVGGTPIDFKDFNNDGLLDVFYNYYCHYSLNGYIQDDAVYLNSGKDFEESIEYTSPIIVSNYYYQGSSLVRQTVNYFTDLNADSVSDYGEFYRAKGSNDSSGNFSRANIYLLNQQLFDTGTIFGHEYFNNPLPVAVADINGDQIQDVIHNPSYFDIYYGQGIKPDILTEVDYQSGAKVNVYYDSSTKEKDEQGNLANSDLPFDLQVVKEVVVNNGQQEWQGYQYQYEDGQTVSYLEDNIKDLYGFAKVEKKLGKAMPDIDFGTGVDGAYVSSENETWTTDKNFTSLNIQSGHTITVEPNVIIKVQGDVVIDGILTAQGQGYPGVNSGQGGSNGPGVGGSGDYNNDAAGGGGGGAGYSFQGENGESSRFGTGLGGIVYGNERLKGIDSGSGGGSGASSGSAQYGSGGNGGGIIQIFANNITVDGEINADGNDGQNGQGAYNHYGGGGGGGSGGSIYIKASESLIINGSIHANGGQGGVGGYFNSGGDGSDGRIRIESPVINGNTNPSYYSRGDFDYSIDNTPSDNNLQKQINYYHTAIEDGLHLHGRPKMTEKYDSSNNLIAKSFNSWQEEDLNNDRKFVYTEQKSDSIIHLLEGADPIEMDVDANTIALYHMDGEVASAEKTDNAQGNSAYDLVERLGSVASDLGFNGETDGAYRSPGGAVNINTNLDDFNGGPFTIEMWVKHNGQILGYRLFGKVLQEFDYGFTAEFNPSNSNILFTSGTDRYNWTVFSEPNSLQLGQWHYLVFSMDTVNAYIYIDGELSGQSPVTVENGNPVRDGDLYLFCLRHNCISDAVPATIDEVRISNIARSPEEIFNYYHNTQEPYFETHTAKQYTYDLTNGNLLTEEDLGKVELDINTGQITNELIGDEKLITHEYAFNPTEHILAAPKTKIISNDTETKQQNLYYDNLPLGQVNSVNLTKEDYIVNQVDIDRTFNNYGLVTTQTDPKGFNTTLAYDSNNLYPTQATNPLNQITYTQYNLFNGQVATSTAPNGLITVNKYDAFGRLTETKFSNPDNPAQLVTKQEVIYYDSSVGSHSFAQEMNFDDNTVALWHFDGELSSESKLLEESGNYNLGEYNNPQNYSGFNGESNGSYLFNGNIDYLRTGNNFINFNQSDFTVEAWVKPESDGIIVRQWPDAGNVSGWLMAITPEGYARFAMSQGNDGTTKSAISDIDLRDNNWHYLVGLRSSDDLKLYVDGRLVATNNGVDNYNISQDNQIYIGWRSSFNDYSGAIDEIRISNLARSNQEILLNFNSRNTLDNNHYTETHNYFDINTYQTSREYYNGLDQVIQKKSQMAGEDQWSTIDIAYDALGRVIRQSLPYVTATVYYTESDLEQPAKTYTYDALDRILTETTPVGTTTYEYDGLTTKIYDANNHRKDLTKDTYGNLVEVKEYNNGEIYTTSYEYNLSNQITKIIDALGNVRNFTYDALGNLISQDMVHVPGAEHIPAMTYTYDKNGNVINKTNFNGQTIVYAYDKLNRPLIEKQNSQYQIQYTYDQGQNNIGQLTKVDYLGGNRQNYNYDILGRLKDYDALIEGQTYNIDYDYNLSGQLTEVIYPDGKQVNYNLNDIGQLNEVLYDDGQNISTLASQLAYNANGQLVGFTRANGFNTNYTYLPEDNYRLTNLTTADGQETLQDIDYVYDPIGNITELTDNGQADLAKTVNYAYDDLNRLLSAEADYLNNTTSDYAITYEYDAIGNMTYNSELGTLDYAYDQPHQVSEANSISYVYDDAGNVLFNGNAEFLWDYRNRLIGSLDASFYPVYYSYDYNNQRLVKTQYKDNGQGGIGTLLSQNHYVDKYFEKDLVNDNAKNHIYLGSIKLATVNDSNDPYFIVGDHLNSSSILVDNSGNIAEVTDYDPYGKINYENGSINDDYGYTGQEYDEESELQYFGARYLDNQFGHFVSVEPAMLVLHDENQLKAITGKELQKILSDPQSLNSYTYSRNNPIILIDPDGNWWKELFTGQQSWSDFQVELGQAAQYMYDNNSVAKTAMDHPYATGAVVGVAGGAAAALASTGLTALSTQYLGGAGTACIMGCDKVKDATNLIGQNISSLGKVIENAPGKINGFNHDGTYHGLDQIISRGVSPQTLLDTVKNPLLRFEGRYDRVGYLTREAYVVLDKTGQVVTSWTRNEFGSTIKNLLNSIQ